jgi:hypothetical protein
MPSQQTLNRFIECVVSGAHDRACEAFYAIDSTMQENGNPPRVGREAHVANERRVLARARAVHSECVGPVLVNADHVMIRWRFRFDWLDGTYTEIEEIAWQRWSGELIAEERFFFDPIQLKPKAA